MVGGTEVPNSCTPRQDEGRARRPVPARLCSPPHGSGSRSAFPTLVHRAERACGALQPCPAWKDIFDLLCIHGDGWEDAAVAGSVRDEEQEVTAGDLLGHKHPARGEKAQLSSPEQQPWHGLNHSKEMGRKQRSLGAECQGKQGEVTLASLFCLFLAQIYNSMLGTINPRTQPAKPKPSPAHHSTEQSLASPRGLSVPV